MPRRKNTKNKSKSRSKSRSPDKVELAQNVNMARFLEGLEDFDSDDIGFDDLPLDVINLDRMNCRDRLSYCGLNRKSRDYCNSEPILSKYIKPCRKQSKFNKTKRKTIEVSRRLSNKYQNELDRMREEIERREMQRIHEEQQQRLQEYLSRFYPPIERPDIEFDDSDDDDLYD